MFLFLRKKAFLKGAGFAALVFLAAALAGCDTGGQPPVNAAQPLIEIQPQNSNWSATEADPFTLNVTASRPDDGNLTYQWYFNTNDSNTNGVKLTGKTESDFTSVKAAHQENTDYYFYVEVTNTIPDNGDGGIKRTSVTSNTARVTVTGNAAGEIVIPPEITGYFQTPLAYSPGWGFIDDGFVIDDGKYIHHNDSIFENIAWKGNIAALVPGAGSGPARLIVQITDPGTWYTNTGNYIAVAYNNILEGSLQAATAFSNNSEAKNNGVATVTEAVYEYTGENNYYEYFGSYSKRPVLTESTAGITGKWYNEDMDYYVVIRGTSYIEYMDDYENPNGDYDGSGSDDMLSMMGNIVECSGTGAESGIFYVKVAERGEYSPFLNDNYVAVGWRNKTGSGSIEFADGNNSESELGSVKASYDDISDFPEGSFYSYTKQ